MRPGIILATLLVAGAAPAESRSDPYGHLRIETAGGYAYATPSASLEHTFILTRGRVALQLGLNESVSTRWAVDAVRSAPETGYIGVDGESILPRVQVAEIAAQWPTMDLHLTMGVVERPWSALGNADWGLRAVNPTLGEREGWIDPADLGATLTLALPNHWGTVWTSLLSGEGFRRRERNEDKTLVLGAWLAPLAILGAGPPGGLNLGVLIQRGRFGVSKGRNHRIAFRLSGGVEAARAGLEYTLAEGLNGDAVPEPTGLSAWLRAMPYGPLLTYARFDLVQEIPQVDDSQRMAIDAGLGLRLHGSAVNGHAYLLLGYRHQRAGKQAILVAGALGADRVDTVLIQLTVDARQAWGAPP